MRMPAGREDRVEAEIGAYSPELFDVLRTRMLGGHYYPEDVMTCYGLWGDEGRRIRPGDRMLQRARVLSFLRGPALWSMTEVTVAEADEDRIVLGYVTTRRHFGRGIWESTVARTEGRIRVSVRGYSGPGSLVFWLCYPIARLLQMRAWRRAIEEMRQLAVDQK